MLGPSLQIAYVIDLDPSHVGWPHGRAYGAGWTAGGLLCL